MNIDEFKYLWTDQKDDYVLVNTEFGYGIVNKREKRVLCISNENLEKEIIEKMLLEGNKTYANILLAYEDV